MLRFGAVVRYSHGVSDGGPCVAERRGCQSRSTVVPGWLTSASPRRERGRVGEQIHGQIVAVRRVSVPFDESRNSQTQPDIAPDFASWDVVFVTVTRVTKPNFRIEWTRYVVPAYPGLYFLTRLRVKESFRSLLGKSSGSQASSSRGSILPSRKPAPAPKATA